MNAALLFPLTFFRLSARMGRMSWGMRLQIGIDQGYPLPSERSKAEFQQHLGSFKQLNAPNQQLTGSFKQLIAPNQQLICPTQRRLAALRHRLDLISLTIAATKLCLGRSGLFPAAPQR